MRPSQACWPLDPVEVDYVVQWQQQKFHFLVFGILLQILFMGF